MLVDAATIPTQIYRTEVVATSASSGSIGMDTGTGLASTLIRKSSDIARLIRMFVGEPASTHGGVETEEKEPVRLRKQDPFEATVLQQTLRNLSRLSVLADNWDGFGSLAPRKAAIARAQELAVAVLSQRSSFLQYLPLVSADENGDVVLEWSMGGPKRVSVFVGPLCTHFVKSWGDNIHSEMESGDITHTGSLLRLLDWVAQG